MANNAAVRLPVVWPGSSSQLAAGDGSAVTVSPASALSGGVFTLGSWTPVYTLDFTAQTTQNIKTGGDTTYTVDGKTWTANGTANTSAASITNGTGLTATMSNTSSFNFYIAASQILSDFGPGARQIGVLVYGSLSPTSSATTQYLVSLAGVNPVTWTMYYEQVVTGASSAIATFGIDSNVLPGTASSTSNLTENVFGYLLPGMGEMNLVTGTYSSGFPAVSSLRTRKMLPAAAPTGLPSDTYKPSDWVYAIRCLGVSGTAATVKAIQFLVR